MSDKAWLIYDDNLNLKEVVWKKPAANFIEISKTLALDFISGHVNFLSYKLTKTNNKIELQTLGQEKSIFTFWNLVSLENSQLDIVFSAKDLRVKIHDNLQSYYSLYCTSRNNPSYLIKSWHLNRCALSHEGIITIQFDNPKKYSWYVGDVK